MTLGQNIQNARRVQGLSQEALAEKIGVSRQALGKWEKDTALPGLLAGVALQYERQISALNQNYAAIQSSYAAQQAELSAQISELQDAVRMGEATVLDWRWLPVDKLHRDADKSWMPVQVQVTPRTTRGGVTARLAVRCGDRRARRQLCGGRYRFYGGQHL